MKKDKAPLLSGGGEKKKQRRGGVFKIAVNKQFVQNVPG